ncbi:MAG: hypothetical protein EU531_00615 [Promethearchaeota archaeon]|nr:MAG: hypothetical protein EU531_00615 [Candidatus Lokiarchaeota archaeon]
MTPTAPSLEALSKLRILNEDFGWYIIPILAIVLYIYAVEIKKARESGNWSTIFAGLTVLGLDLINEIWNALVFAFSGYSAFWTTPGASAYIILIGWNIEIAFMFSIAGIVFAKLLPEDKEQKIFGLSNRWAMAAGFAIFCVIVEILLNWGNYLIWEYVWWHWYNPVLIFLIGYFHFFVGAFYVYDLPERKDKIKFVAIIYGISVILLCIFGPLLGPLGIF